jgi:DNA-directed RNA polymerase II subunit RPB2
MARFVFGAAAEAAAAVDGAAAAGSSSAASSSSSVSKAERALLHEVLRHEVSMMPMEQLYESLGGAGASAAAAVQRIIATEFLQHLGIDDAPHTMLKKAKYVGLIVRRLLAVHMRREPVDDRDDYGSKRVCMVGLMLGGLFRQQMRRFVRTVERTLVQLAHKERFIDIPDVIAARSMTGGLAYAFNTGNWTQQRSSGTHVGITQLVSRMSHMAFASALGRVNTRVCREGSSGKARQLHTSRFGRLCPSETPEGQSSGLVKNLALTAVVRVGTPSPLIAAVLLEELGLRPWTGGAAADDAAGDLLLVNGDIVGVCPHAVSAAAYAATLRTARRNGVLPWDVSIVCAAEGLLLHSDAGCILRPLFVVERLGGLPAVLAAAADRPGPALWRAALAAGIVEYVDNTEEEVLLVAPDLGQVDSSPGGAAAAKYTHAEIHPIAMLGMVASLTPFSDHNQAPRNIYQAAMAKQAVAVPALNYLERMDATAHVPRYVQRPLVETCAAGMLGISDIPMGVNMCVAICSYSGYNQEDSLIFNLASVQRGLGVSEAYHTYRDVALTADRQKFENPEAVPQCAGLQHANYSKLDAHGVVAPGTRVYAGDVISGKTLSSVDTQSGGVQPGGGARRVVAVRDQSTVYRGTEPATVNAVMLASMKDGSALRKTQLRAVRTPQVGDKFSSRHGQKGTIGRIEAPENMPFVAAGANAGMTPDVIINPNALTSRMTIGQLIEGLLSKLGCALGRAQDGTPFQRHVTAERIGDALHAAGFQRHGNERMRNGMTGEMLEADVFFCPVFYQKLKHMVEDKMHGRSLGPVNALTKQPTEGRGNNGGLRFGEMERDCAVMHGAAAVLKDRLVRSSAPAPVPVCRKCGFIGEHAPPAAAGVVGPRGSGAPYCRACDVDDVAMVEMPYPYKLLVQELYSMGVVVRHQVEGAPVPRSSSETAK